MSIESLKKRKDIIWVDEKSFKRGEFGPPIYEESQFSYKWRLFKRGFTWGFLLTFVAMTQYSALSYFLRPHAKQLYIYLAQPLVYGVAVGGGFGIYENICYRKQPVTGYLEYKTQEKDQKKIEKK